jgi:hypothetical protein
MTCPQCRKKLAHYTAQGRLFSGCDYCGFSEQIGTRPPPAPTPFDRKQKVDFNPRKASSAKPVYDHLRPEALARLIEVAAHRAPPHTPADLAVDEIEIQQSLALP